MESKIYNYTDSDIVIIEKDLTIKPNEYAYINAWEGFSIYSFDEARKIHKHDVIKPKKLCGETIAVGQLVYEKIFFINDNGYDCDEIIGLGFIVPKYIDNFYNISIIIVYSFTLFIMGILLFLLNRKVIFYK